MKKIHYLVLITTFSVFFSAFVNADVYKWKDEQGIWRYSDIKPMNVKDVLLLKSKLPNKDKSIGTHELALDKVSTKSNDAPQSQVLVTQNEDPAIKQSNCNTAKTQLATYRNGGRIQRMNDRGELAFISDEEIAIATTKSQALVKQYCE
jgi:hypothetical protein